jgi:hypothetical protein
MSHWENQRAKGPWPFGFASGFIAVIAIHQRHVWRVRKGWMFTGKA